TGTQSAQRHTLSLHDALPICRATAATATPAWNTDKPVKLVRAAPMEARPGYSAVTSTSGLGWNRCPVWRMASTLYVWVSSSENRSEEHTSELQSRGHLVCRLL